MNQTLLHTLTVTGFSVAFLHAAIPTHWLPFVVIGRARGWSQRRTLGAVALAGGGHIVATTALGIGLAWFGFELEERFHVIFHWAIAAVLVGLGLWLAFRAPHGAACRHCQGHPEKLVPDATDTAALWGLFLTLTLSPCELFLPVYLTAVPYGWPGIAWLSAVLALATLGGMLTLTWLTLRGVERLRWRWLTRLDERVIGALLCLLGVATVVLEH
jgi:nickel/cobalt transporter (NicO) family protein